MDAISGATGSSAWSQVPELMQKLDDTYCKHLRLHIETDGSRNSVAKAAWESYCLELGRIFSERFPDWESAIPFFQNLSREYDCIGPMITSSYIEDLSTLWTEVHPALLEVRARRFSLGFVDFIFRPTTGFSLARAVHRLRTRLPLRDTTTRCDDHTRASRARAVQSKSAGGPQRTNDVLYHASQQRE